MAMVFGYSTIVGVFINASLAKQVRSYQRSVSPLRPEAKLVPHGPGASGTGSSSALKVLQKP
jgi:hypothetical protein